MVSREMGQIIPVTFPYLKFQGITEELTAEAKRAENKRAGKTEEGVIKTLG